MYVHVKAALDYLTERCLTMQVGHIYSPNAGVKCTNMAVSAAAIRFT
jgi:hypothetical protein